MLNLVKNLFSNLSIQAAAFSLVINTAIFGTMAISLSNSSKPEVTSQDSAVVDSPVITQASVVETPKPSKLEYLEVIDVAASIRSWNEEAWCRTHWDNGVKCWFKDRQEQYPAKAKAIAKAFNKVWGSSPIEVQKLALAVCLKETGCGFSEERNWKKSGNSITQTGERTYKSHKFMSNKEACGITQVDTRDNVGKVKCAVLNASYENAFKWQKIWLETYWNDGHKITPTKIDLYSKEWLKRYQINENNSSYLIWRYNGGGKGAWRYGRITMEIYKNHIVTKKVKVAK